MRGIEKKENVSEEKDRYLSGASVAYLLLRGDIPLVVVAQRVTVGVDSFVLLAIPFSHSFLAVQNMFLGNYRDVVFGMLYMAAFFTVLVILAGRIFSSDKVLTMKLRWGKKKVVL